MRSGLNRHLLTAVLLLLATLRATAGQAPVGAIHGIVLDTAGGAPVGDVTVRLQSSGTSVQTDSSGTFHFEQVPPGRHDVAVSSADLLLVERSIDVEPGAIASITIMLSEGTAALTQSVTVTASGFDTSSVVAEHTLERNQLQELRGLFTNDPFRAIQVLPGVAMGDDMRSDFTVRGSPSSRMLFTFEGIAAPFLVHTVQRVTDNASLAMINGDVLGEITLVGGSYPQRYGDRIGASLDFRMREGSRARLGGRVSVTGLDSAVVLEGPLGPRQRGSWLASIRKSYLGLVSSRIESDVDFSFGFNDAQSKIVYDVTPSQQLQFSLSIGRSLLELEPELLQPDDPKEGRNGSTLAVLAWRSMFSPGLVLTQRAGVTSADFRNTNVSAVELARGVNRDWFYRPELTANLRQGLALEIGGEARSTTNSAQAIDFVGANRIDTLQRFDASAVTVGAYAQTPLSGRNWTVVPGVRIDHWSFDDSTTVSPWAQFRRSLTPRLTVRAGTGLYRQRPTFDQLIGLRGNPDLLAEQAIHLDGGVEGTIGGTLRWQAAFYQRQERHVIRLPGSEFRVVNGILILPSATTHYRNGMNGHARGVDLVLERRAPLGLSGWLAYSYGVSRYEDEGTGETFYGDYDQRHTINAYGQYRLTDRFNFSGRFRHGSNFPTPGYWQRFDERNFVGTTRNTLRVPVYSRLDLRVSRLFTLQRTRWTLFVEVLNALNHHNERFASPSIDRRTLEVRGLWSTMFPRVPSAGLLFEF